MVYDGSINQPVLDQVSQSAHSILDVGCGGGTMGATLKSTFNCSITGITFNDEEAAIAQKRLDKVVVADLNSYDPSVLEKFDCILCCHVLEHLHAPERLLGRLHACLMPGGSLIVALPNILFWKQRLQFMRGRFRYTRGGVMDSTHFRFFDWDSAAKLLTDSGYIIRHRIGDGGFPLSRFLPQFIRRGLNRLTVKCFPGAFAWQFVFRCQSALPAKALDQGAAELAASTPG